MGGRGDGAKTPRERSRLELSNGRRNDRLVGGREVRTRRYDRNSKEGGKRNREKGDERKVREDG